MSLHWVYHEIWVTGMDTVVMAEGMSASEGGSNVPNVIVEEAEVSINHTATNSSLGKQYYLCITADSATHNKLYG